MINEPTPVALILTVPDPAPVAILVTALNVPGALRSEGRESVTAPVEPDADIWFAVPAIDDTPVDDVKYVFVSSANVPAAVIFTNGVPLTQVGYANAPQEPI